jgi:hypothetical protein
MCNFDQHVLGWLYEERDMGRHFSVTMNEKMSTKKFRLEKWREETACKTKRS